MQSAASKTVTEMSGYRRNVFAVTSPAGPAPTIHTNYGVGLAIVAETDLLSGCGVRGKIK